MQKRKIVKVITILLLTIYLFGASSCFGALGGLSKLNYSIEGELQMSVDYTQYLGYSCSIKGKLKNKSLTTYSYVSVTFAVYDENGIQIENAMDNMNYLQSGGIWQFNATMLGWTDVRPKSCKLVDVTMF